MYCLVQFSTLFPRVVCIVYTPGATTNSHWPTPAKPDYTANKKTLSPTTFFNTMTVKFATPVLKYYWPFATGGMSIVGGDP